MENNALLVRSRLEPAGFTLNAIAGILGNMQTESSINPGIWQSLKPFAGGYGLVQWTPYTNYSEWAGDGWEDNGDKECERIIYEFTNGLQYYPTSAYPLSAADFMSSHQTPEYLATAFLKNYERPKNQNQPWRRTQARAWFNFLNGGEPPDPPDPPPDPPDPPEPPDVNTIPWLLFKVADRNRGILW